MTTLISEKMYHHIHKRTTYRYMIKYKGSILNLCASATTYFI